MYPGQPRCAFAKQVDGLWFLKTYETWTVKINLKFENEKF